MLFKVFWCVQCSSVPVHMCKYSWNHFLKDSWRRQNPYKFFNGTDTSIFTIQKLMSWHFYSMKSKTTLKTMLKQNSSKILHRIIIIFIISLQCIQCYAVHPANFVSIVHERKKVQRNKRKLPKNSVSRWHSHDLGLFFMSLKPTLLSQQCARSCFPLALWNVPSGKTA